MTTKKLSFGWFFIFDFKMISNVFLFSGEEKYLLHQELKRWTDSFVQKYGSDSLLVYKTDDFSLESLRQAIYSGGLFIQKRLIIVYGIPGDGDISNKLSAAVLQQFSDEFIQRGGKIVAENILIFVSYKPDKRTKLYSFLKKELNQDTGIRDFLPMKTAELKLFVRQKTPLINLSESALDLFLTKTGSSLLHIQNELDKLKLLADSKGTKNVSEKDIELITFGLSEANNFEFFDTLFVNKKKALDLISRLQEEGQNRNAFAGTLYWGLKIWIFILDCFEQNIKDSKIISSIIKAHPFTVSKAIKHIDVLSSNKKGIISFYLGLIDLENDIKSGKKSDFNFWLDVKKLVYSL